MKRIIVVVATFGIVSCQEGLPPASSPTAPTGPKTSSSIERNGSNGRPEIIVVGGSFASSVSTEDPECDTADPGIEDGALRAPCRTFQFTAPRSGTFFAELRWSTPGTYMEMLTASTGKCCTSPLRIQFSIQPGETYIFSVGLHAANAALPPATAFELTTSIVP